MVIAISVSTNYDDILRIILPQNYKFFTGWYIITHRDDLKTINVLKEFNFPNIKVMFFDFYSNKKTFNKGGAVRSCQQYLTNIGYNGDVLLLDSDIYLPDNFQEILQKMEISDLVLYGTEKRFDYYTYDNFKNNKFDRDYEPATYIPGYFQLYKHKPTLLYEESDDCSACDWTFRYLFRNRFQIKGLFVHHLGQGGVNWSGRKGNDFIF